MKSPTTKNSNFFSNEKGFSLTEVMIAGGMLGVLALVSVQLTKNSSDVQHKGTVDADIKSFKSNFSSIIYNPAHCNANFMNSPANSSLYTCDVVSTGACNGSATRTAVYSVNTTNWQSIGFSNKVRIKSITRSSPSAASGDKYLAPATITVVLETRPSSNPAAIREETVVFSTAIVVNGSTLLGCPKSVNSTVIY